MTDDNRYKTTPFDEAFFKASREAGEEPPQRIARRIAGKYGAGPYHPLVDDISHAIEDARELGVKLAPYVRS